LPKKTRLEHTSKILWTSFLPQDKQEDHSTWSTVYKVKIVCAVDVASARNRQIGTVRLHKTERELLVTCKTGGGDYEYPNLVGGIAMTKAELVSKLAEETKVTKKVAAAMLDSLVKTLQSGLKDGGRMRIDGLGTFEVADRKARNGVNPRTGAQIKIPATKAPVFRAAKALKEAVKAVPKKAGKKSK
jgi:DNA-binding protein HU-beta